ncbi:prevent-host-death protein [Kineosporia mesophila]|uniref:Prevent-host-death protein n=1 Tax=Kineosporia mesophila TaxID=566012 RepID=A0ABP6ZWH7_9ACTN|nr:type II toxin-antitoxin system Phd/YefM family antitoxin [Kineosporia mesophila]MCD5353300.1 type II toxin-antitoxin system Phd/YefM family antitoxin [Kineosporia mesophila]
MGISAVDPQTVQSSDLSRNSASVFAAADRGPVTITRRDGEPFVLLKASEVEFQRRGLELAAQLVAASLAPGDQPFAERLRVSFPWVEFLKPEDRLQFAQEIVDVARACAAVSRFDRLLLSLREWRSTAEALAQGYTPDDELIWIDEPVRVANPRDE